MQIRDRIKQLKRVPASELEPNPKNWRTHPQKQQDALRGVLAEIGYASALLAREAEDGTLQLIDGHLRAEITPDAKVPVLILDVTEEEADKILLTHDPLASLATADEQSVGDLLETCDFNSQAVGEMLDQLQQEIAKPAWPYDSSADQAGVEIPELFQVVVECNGESEQQSVYNRMRKEGYSCRVLTL